MSKFLLNVLKTKFQTREPMLCGWAGNLKLIFKDQEAFDDPTRVGVLQAGFVGCLSWEFLVSLLQ